MLLQIGRNHLGTDPPYPHVHTLDLNYRTSQSTDVFLGGIFMARPVLQPLIPYTPFHCSTSSSLNERFRGIKCKSANEAVTCNMKIKSKL